MKPFGQLAVAFICGIFIAYFINVPFFYVYISCAIILLITIVSIDKGLFPTFLLISSLLLGYLVYKNAILTPENHIKNFTPAKKVYLQGIVVSDIEDSVTSYGVKSSTFIMEAKNLNVEGNWTPVSGLVKSYVYGKNAKAAYGDEILLEGKLLKPEGKRNPGGFDHRRYLEQDGIYSLVKVDEGGFIRVVGRGAKINFLKKLAFSVRRKVNAVISEYLSGEQASLLEAMLLGKRKTLSYNLRDAFVKTGTVHILAISGLHVGLIAFILYIIFGAFHVNQKFAIPLIISLLFIYALMTGSRIPVIRATTMISIMLVGRLFRRDSSSINSISLAALIILLINPRQLFSSGFQLSFIAVLSIFCLTPKIDKRLKLDKFYYIKKLFSVSVAAWIGVTGLVAYYFNIVSPIAIFSNLLIIPLAFFIIASSLSFIIFSFLIKPLGLVFASAAAGAIQFLQLLADNLGRLPLAYFRVKTPSIFVIFIYYTIVLMIFNYRQLKLSKVRLVIIIMLIFNLAIWPSLFGNGGEGMEITFLDVGQGDAAFIQFPHYGNMLIDGGEASDKSGIDMGRSVIIPFLCERGVYTIDAVLLSHPHTDHVGGLGAVLEDFRASYVFDNGVSYDTKPFQIYKEKTKKRGINYYTLKRGDAIIGYRDANIYILHPNDPAKYSFNDGSLVIKIVYKDKTILFCGDIMEEGAEELLAFGDSLNSTVMKVPHHGRGIESENIRELFFRLTAPEIAVISWGDKKPSTDVLAELKLNGAKIYHTKKGGAITVTLDERGYRIRTMKD